MAHFSVSLSPFGLDFGTLDFGLGLDNCDNVVCDQEQWNTMSPLFNDVHVMVFLGIAFILTFLRSYRCGQITWDNFNTSHKLDFRCPFEF